MIYPSGKRFLDILLALPLLLACLPLMALIWISIKLESPGPAIFTQWRVGRDLQQFQIFKFRTMVPDAPYTGSFRSAVNDPRITKVGRFLRRSSMDELPQLLNVLRGEMSFVGPRPDVPAQEGDYSAAQWQKRHRVRPGITGLAQVTSRSAATAEERLRNDLDYVDRMSFLLDVKIMAKTLLVLAGSRTN